MKAVIELVGPEKTGKTTLTDALSRLLEAGPVLLIDASINQGLTRLLDQAPGQTLTDLVQSFLATPAHTQESIDWAFHELPRPVDDQGDLVTLGPLSDNLPESIEEMLAYGLKRLVAMYEVVVVDGYHPLVHRLLRDELLRTVVVATPDDPVLLPSGFEAIQTPSLIINRHTGEKTGPVISDAIARDEVRLVGKIPLFANTGELESRLSEALSDCLLRMNLPFRTTGAL